MILTEKYTEKIVYTYTDSFGNKNDLMRSCILASIAIGNCDEIYH